MTAYAVTAQFYDALRDPAHEIIHTRIAAALARRRLGDHPLIDIGAGTGLTTLAVAKAVPHIEILALEPDPAMRPALMTRVAADPDLRRRVSILPTSVLDAPLSATISAAIASASQKISSSGE